jgi:hypothetical protein
MRNVNKYKDFDIIEKKFEVMMWFVRQIEAK